MSIENSLRGSGFLGHSDPNLETVEPYIDHISSSTLDSWQTLPLPLGHSSMDAPYFQPPGALDPLDTMEQSSHDLEQPWLEHAERFRSGWQ